MEPTCSYCDAYLGPLLSSALSPAEGSSLRAHAAGCAYCALRVGAAERLAARWPARTIGDALAVSEPVQTTEKGRAGKRRPRRTVVSVALGVATAFVMLTSGRGPLLGSPGLLDAATVMAHRQYEVALAAEERARRLVACGSPIPESLIPTPLLDGTDSPPGGCRPAP